MKGLGAALPTRGGGGGGGKKGAKPPPADVDDDEEDPERATYLRELRARARSRRRFSPRTWLRVGVRRAQELFDEIDADGSGEVDADELEDALRAAGAEIDHDELVAMMNDVR